MKWGVSKLTYLRKKILDNFFFFWITHVLYIYEYIYLEILKRKKKNGPQSGSAITKSSGGILGFLFLFFLSHADLKDVNNAKKCFKF